MFRVVRTTDTGSKEILDRMHHLRWQVFHEKMGWRKGLQVMDMKEYDEYDDHEAIYLVRVEPDGQVSACARLRSTTSRYMIADHYAGHLHHGPAPRAPHIWEISRFCWADEWSSTKGNQQAFLACLEYGVAQGMTAFLALATMKIVIIPRRIGWPYVVIGGPFQEAEDTSQIIQYEVSPAVLDLVRGKCGVSGSLFTN